MTFIETYDRLLPLEDQMEFPLKRHGIELYSENKKYWGIHKERNAVLTSLESAYLAVLLQDGYLTSEELEMNLHSENVVPHIARNRIRHLRGKLGYDSIMTRSGSSFHSSELYSQELSGYYVGGLQNHRKEFEISKKDIVFNTLTGFVQFPEGSTTLRPREARAFELFFKRKEVYPQSLAVYVYNSDSSSCLNSVKNVICKLREKIGKERIETVYSAPNHYKLT